MRATLRITWLLLSLSLRFDAVCSDGATSVSKNTATVTPAPTVVQLDDKASGTKPSLDTQPTRANVSEAPTTHVALTKGQTTQAPSPAPTTTAVVVTAPPVIVTTKANPTFKPDADQAQDANNPATPLPASASGVASTVKHDATPPVATPSIPTIFSPASTADSRTSAGIVDVSDGSNRGTTGTQGPVMQPENTGHVGATTVSTDGPTIGGQPMIPTTIPSTMSQETSKEVKDTMTITASAKSHEQTESRASEPTGHTETTNAPLPSTSFPVHSVPPAAETTVSQAETTSLQTTLTPDLSPTTTMTTTTTTTIAEAHPKSFLYSLNNGHEKEEEKDLVEVCRRLMANLQDGNCSLTWRHRNGKIQFDSVEINGKVSPSLAAQYYEEIIKKPTDNRTLIAILASCGALLIMIVILAVCASHHRKPYNETQQHLTEELHTVENGYHDNPTLEVMEVQPEMQEKKMALNGEFNDSWIVPIDNLLKEDIPDEEDTHL